MEYVYFAKDCPIMTARETEDKEIVLKVITVETYGILTRVN